VGKCLWSVFLWFRVGTSEQSYGPVGSIRGGGFLDHLSKQRLSKDCFIETVTVNTGNVQHTLNILLLQ
jgi:hypothetical protein